MVSLVAYAVKAMKAYGTDLDTDLVVGVSIPVVAIFVALGVRHIRKMVTRGRV